MGGQRCIRLVSEAMNEVEKLRLRLSQRASRALRQYVMHDIKVWEGGQDSLRFSHRNENSCCSNKVLIWAQAKIIY